MESCLRLDVRAAIRPQYKFMDNNRLQVCPLKSNYFVLAYFIVSGSILACSKNNWILREFCVLKVRVSDNDNADACFDGNFLQSFSYSVNTHLTSKHFTTFLLLPSTHIMQIGNYYNFATAMRC